MNINFFEVRCQEFTDSDLFGICDSQIDKLSPAYIDEANDETWIANVWNEENHQVTFTAIDNCIPVFKADGTQESRCDGMLTYNDHIVFVELKERGVKNNVWIPGGENQLRITIARFENNHDMSTYKTKRAFLANSKKPLFQSSQQSRMDKFEDETGVRLRIENDIIITG